MAARIAPALLVLTGLGVAGIGAELLVRAVAPQGMAMWAQSPEGVALMQRNRRFRVPPWEHGVETNELGHRDASHRSDEPGARRVVVLGDSFAEALTVSFDDMFATQLRRRLSQTAPTVVVNAGISGWGTDDQLRYFEAHGRELRPDLVLVLFTVYNDLTDNLEREFHRSTSGGLVTRPEAEPSGPSYVMHRIKAFLASRFHLVQLARLTLTPRDYSAEGQALQRHWVDLVRPEVTATVDEGWELTFDLLDALTDSTRAMGAELALVAIPMEFQVDSDALAEFMEQIGGPAPADLDLDAPQRALLDWGAKRGVEVLDLRPDLIAEIEASGPVYLKDDGHWNPLGHSAAAEATFRWLNAMDWKGSG